VIVGLFLQLIGSLLTVMHTCDAEKGEKELAGDLHARGRVRHGHIGAMTLHTLVYASHHPLSLSLSRARSLSLALSLSLTHSLSHSLSHSPTHSLSDRLTGVALHRRVGGEGNEGMNGERGKPPTQGQRQVGAGGR
jgi:hypothetical protein